MQPEAKFKRRLVESFQKVFPAGWYGYTRLVTGKGLPDLRFAAGGKGIWVEAKVRPNTLSKTQTLVTGKMAAAGERVVVLTLHGSEGPKADRSVHAAIHAKAGDAPFLHGRVWSESMLATPDFWSVLLGTI